MGDGKLFQNRGGIFRVHVVSNYADSMESQAYRRTGMTELLSLVILVWEMLICMKCLSCSIYSFQRKIQKAFGEWRVYVYKRYYFSKLV